MPRLRQRDSGGKGETTRLSGAGRRAARGVTRHALTRAIPFIDKAIVGTGVLTAVLSASFAAYMVSTEHPHPMFGGIEHLMIFAQPSLGPPRETIALRRGAASKPAGIDYTATGSIPAKDPAAEAGPPLVTDLPEPILNSYVLHDVHDGVATVVVQGDGTYRIEQGSVLPGVGRVLSIEQRGRRWVVVTPQGLITDGSF